MTDRDLTPAKDREAAEALAVIQRKVQSAYEQGRAEGRAEEREQLEAYAAFGSDTFEAFWADGEPGDVDWADCQERAITHGLLTRRTEAQAAFSCAEGCDWEAGKPLDECECLFPTRGTIRARGEQGGK